MVMVRLILLALFLFFPFGVVGEFAIKREFPTLSFVHPLDFRVIDSDPSGTYIVQRDGRIFRIGRDGTKALFVDIRALVTTKGWEQGLLGLAFDPKYQENRFFYLYYTSSNRGTVTVSRFKEGTGSPEEELLTLPQPYSNHNGGAIEFGPDGALYLGIGDGGAGGDPFNHGQNRRTLLGTITRIDLNSTKKEPKVFAYGLRNPWRFSFDSVTGKLWVGDVGQNKYEEVHIVEEGKNYGWNIMEGDECFGSSACNQRGLEKPIVTYGRGDGWSITGGHVYRGSEIPELYGKYIYGDHVSGKVWALSVDDKGKLLSNEFLFKAPFKISSFGIGHSKELCLLSYIPGEIYRIVKK